MVRKRFDRTVVKRCPQCEENVPVACKFCTCGHQFATRNKILLKEEAEEAMGQLDGSAPEETKKGDDDNTPEEPRRRPRRLTRERPNYYVITTELSRHVKRKVRQRERNRTVVPKTDGIDTNSNNTPKKKKRGRPRGSGTTSATTGTRTRSKTRKLSDHYQNNNQSSSSHHHGLQIKKEDGFTDTKNSSIASSSSYGRAGDKPLTNVTVSICSAPNSRCTTNLSNCNVTKHHLANNSSYTSSSHNISGSHSKDITLGKYKSSSSHSNRSTGINTKYRGSNDLNNSSNNSSYNNCNNNNQKDNGGERDMYSSMSFEKAMKCYAILADLNRKIISQSFKPL